MILYTVGGDRGLSPSGIRDADNAWLIQSWYSGDLEVGGLALPINPKIPNTWEGVT